MSTKPNRGTRPEPTVATPLAESSPSGLSSAPTPEQIRRRAYEYFLSRNGGGGDPVADWLRAEAELRAEFARQTPVGVS